MFFTFIAYLALNVEFGQTRATMFLNKKACVYSVRCVLNLNTKILLKNSSKSKMLNNTRLKLMFNPSLALPAKPFQHSQTHQVWKWNKSVRTTVTNSRQSILELVTRQQLTYKRQRSPKQSRAHGAFHTQG